MRHNLPLTPLPRGLRQALGVLISGLGGTLCSTELSFPEPSLDFTGRAPRCGGGDVCLLGFAQL